MPVHLEPIFIQPIFDKTDPIYSGFVVRSTGEQRHRKLYKMKKKLFLRDQQKLGYIIYSDNYCDFGNY